MSDFLLPNSYQFPNAYCDRLMYLLTPAEWKVLSYAVRRIFGFQKFQDRISLSQFIHGTVSTKDGKPLDHGTGLSRPTVIACLDSLIRYRLITKLADSDPVKRDGDLYALQLEYDKVDYVGLVERANNRSDADLKRTAQGRSDAASKRLSIPLIGQSDLPVVPVNPIDQYRSIPLTNTGQSDLPQPVNPIDPQYQEETKQETQMGIYHPDFIAACARLKSALPIDYEQSGPVLLEVDEHPNRMRVKLAAVPAGFMDAFKSALEQVARRRYAVSFETPGTGQYHPQPPAPQRDNGQGEMKPDDSLKQEIPGSKMTPEMVWNAALGELQLEMTRATFDTWLKPARLLSVNGSWQIGVSDRYAKDFLDGRLHSTIKRIFTGILNRPVQVEFVVVDKEAK